MEKSRRIWQIFLLLGIFSIAMGFMEAIVVVYLRQIYYPQGFNFPLNPLSLRMLSLEMLREITTIIMLAMVALITGRNYLQRFSFFLYIFSIWDIFYYLGLKLLLGWPSSLLEWDILFLIPITWVGPVLAPIICSLTMIVLAVCLIILQNSGKLAGIRLSEWGQLISGALIVFYTFVNDYSRIIIRGGFLSGFWRLTNNEQFQQLIFQYVPVEYNWYLFGIGEFLALSALTLIIIRTKSVI